MNRIRAGERGRECRDLEVTKIAIGRGAQLISQMATVEVPTGGPPEYGARPTKEKRRKKKG